MQGELIPVFVPHLRDVSFSRLLALNDRTSKAGS